MFSCKNSQSTLVICVRGFNSEKKYIYVFFFSFSVLGTIPVTFSRTSVQQSSAILSLSRHVSEDVWIWLVFFFFNRYVPYVGSFKAKPIFNDQILCETFVLSPCFKMLIWPCGPVKHLKKIEASQRTLVENNKLVTVIITVDLLILEEKNSSGNWTGRYAIQNTTYYIRNGGLVIYPIRNHTDCT